MLDAVAMECIHNSLDIEFVLPRIRSKKNERLLIERFSKGVTLPVPSSSPLIVYFFGLFEKKG